MATPGKQSPASQASFDVRRRSNRGCIDCKVAKVRCDELHPSCGTCTRRQRRCRGYVAPAHTRFYSKERQQKFLLYVPTNARSKWITSHSNVSPLDTQMPASPTIEPTAEGFGRALSLCSITGAKSDMQSGLIENEAVQVPTSLDLMTCNEPIAYLSVIPRSIPVIPPGTISDADAETINIYFNRHPFEQVISLEFVEEMNASVFMVLQDSPVTVGDALYSIGRVYLEEDGQGSLLPLALERRGRTLARLKVKDPSREIEQMLLMSLALGAMEGIDTRCKPHDRTSSTLMMYATSFINKYVRSGLRLSSLAKYFIRALARHDMIISLSQQRRNLIKTEMWLDKTANCTDRFMGYTTTLMPLLEELCGLAEDIRFAKSSRYIPYGSEDTVSILPSIIQNVNDLRSRIQSWRWVFGHGDSTAIRSSGRLIAHAFAYRAAALLMLYRLIYPAGRSVESDQEAFRMACEVMVYLKEPPEDLGLLTWPALISSCELESEEDRAIATNIFRNIYSVRKTGTSLQSMAFVIERVWKARDNGEDWDWMKLSQMYPGECIPL